MADWVLFDNFRLNQTDGDAVNFATGGDTIKISLHTVTYVPDQAADDFFDDVTNEVSGTNYTAGGSTLASKTLVLATGVVTFDAADVTFLQSGGGFTNARIAVMRKDTGTPATSVLIMYGDLLADKGNVAGDLTLQMDADGIWTSP